MFEREAVIVGSSAKNGYALQKSFAPVVNTRRMIVVRTEDNEVSDKNEGQENLNAPIKKKKYRMIRRHPAKIFDCTECGKTFKHPSKIAEHVRIHTGERPFRCELCGAGFSQGNSLKVHLRIHRGERPYSCDFCDRGFLTSSQKKSHEKTHLRKPRIEPLVYVCPAEGCNARFARKERIANHIQTGHPELGEIVEEVDEKRIVINTVEDLIEQVNEPDDVHEEQVWDQAPEDEYFTEVIIDGQALHTEEVHCYSDQATNKIGDLEKDGVDEVLLPALGSPATFIEESVDILESETETLVVDGCTVNTLPAIVAEELPDAVAVEGEELEQIYVGSEEIVDNVGGKTETVHNYVCNSDGAYYETTVDEQGAVYQEEELARKQHGMFEGEFLVDGTSLIAVPTVSYVEKADGVDGYLYSDTSFLPPPIITKRRRLKRSEQGLLAGTHHLEIDPFLTSKHSLDSKESGLKIVADARPPRKGRRRSEEDTNSHKLEVDPAIFEMAAPVKRTREATERLMYAGGYIYRPRPARNLDWIIDAVAKGQDVDKASPHNRRKPQMHQCEYCGRVDKYPSKIQAHMRTHTGEKPFKCDICGMGFSQRTPMRMHIRRHLNQKPYVCDIDGCGERFINGSLLNAHQNAKHFIRKRYACMRGCGRSFAQARNQRKHEAKCNHRIALRESSTEPQMSSLSGGYGTTSGLRAVSREKSIASAPQKFCDNCKEYDEIEDHGLVDGGHFLEAGDEQSLIGNQQLETFDERLIDQNIEPNDCESTNNIVKGSSIDKTKQEVPEVAFDDRRPTIDRSCDNGWLL